MPEFALTLNLKNDAEVIGRYKQYHAETWPEVVAALQQVGILDMRIWLLGRRLFMVYKAREGFDPEVDFPRYLKLHPRCQEWENLMGTLQEPVEDAQPGEKWAAMEKVFDLGWF